MAKERTDRLCPKCGDDSVQSFILGFPDQRSVWMLRCSNRGCGWGCPEDDYFTTDPHNLDRLKARTCDAEVERYKQTYQSRDTEKRDTFEGQKTDLLKKLRSLIESLEAMKFPD